MMFDPSAKTRFATETQRFPKIKQAKKKEKTDSVIPNGEKSPYDKMEAVRSYARRRKEKKTKMPGDRSTQSKKGAELLDAVSIDSGCSSDKSTDGEMKRVERILQNVRIGKTRAAGYVGNDVRAARRLHYVVAHGPGPKVPQKSPKRENMNRFYTPGFDPKTQGHSNARTRSVPSSWQPHGDHGQGKGLPKYQSPSDGACKYYCRNYPDYLREMQMERLLKKQRRLQAITRQDILQETEVVPGHDLRELSKPSSPNRYNQQYSFACFNVKKPLRLPKLTDQATESPGEQNAVTDRRSIRKKDQGVVMSSKDIVNLRTKIRMKSEKTTRLSGMSAQQSSTENVAKNVPVRVPCPPRTTGMQKYFDRGSNEARMRQAGGLMYTANPRATGYVNGGVISFRGGKETVYMLKEITEPRSTDTLENTVAGSRADNDRVTVTDATAQKCSATSFVSPKDSPPVNAPVSQDIPGSGGEDEFNNSRWVGRIYQPGTGVAHADRRESVPESDGQYGAQQTSFANLTKENDTFVHGANDLAGSSLNKQSEVGSVRVIPSVNYRLNTTEASIVVMQDGREENDPASVVTDDRATTSKVPTPLFVEQDVDNPEDTNNPSDSAANDGESTSKMVTSLLAVPAVHAERIRTLQEGYEGKNGDPSIPEIRMIAATPLPPDFEV